ncbi:C4-dicarboxylate transporter/malic acid transport protein [Penicillium nucicola]|uniref:C4-dicarboxylate transporter/malic acid transport protein n=1 Tax=Penicillium nucicola TaxID=1850975 RepID=UPI00254587FA|nr:C4-dicarboxylate transporter/malic acid transport protein [Penicillium nucicola]KAJ5748709.1 C4-dicarboxylate transporter/malic acid transport protein [Penicillium nucicola]
MPIERETIRPPSHPLSLALWNFSSQWFLIPQGTGIIPVLFHRLDYQFTGLMILAKIVWVYTITLLGICLILYLLRTILYPKHVIHQLRTNLTETACLSCISIAFTSILQLAVLEYGEKAGLEIYILWWINTAMAIIACAALPFIHLTLQSPEINSIPTSILLPFIATLASAACSGVVCRFSHVTPELQAPAIIVAYLQVGAGLTLATVFDVILILQYLNCTHPTPETVCQDMILCGPFGQGSFALQVLGQAVNTASVAAYDREKFLTVHAAGTIGFISLFLGLLVWGMGCFGGVLPSCVSCIR